MNNLCFVETVFFMRKNLFFYKNFFFSSTKTFFSNFYEFNCLSIFIAKANTIKWRYASAKALGFANC